MEAGTQASKPLQSNNVWPRLESKGLDGRSKLSRLKGVKRTFPPVRTYQTHQLEIPSRWARDISSAAETLASVFGLLTVLLCLRTVLTTLNVFGKGLHSVLIRLGLGRRPLLTASLSAVWFSLVASPIGSSALQGMPGGATIRFIALLLALILLVAYEPLTLEPPPSLEAVRDRPRTAVEAWIAERMKNPVDGVWVRPVVVFSLLTIPAVAGMSFAEGSSIPAVLLYGVVLALSESRLNAFEHAYCHYHLFEGRHLAKRTERTVFRLLNAYCAYFLPILCARIPKWYAVQHVVVHHAEDNGPEDTQSTLRYDRASFVDLARCANRSALSGLFAVDLIAYLKRKRRKRALQSLLGGMLAFYSVLVAVAIWNWQLAAVVVAFRYAGCLTTAMGFFQEHGLVDIAAPTNVYRNSLHFISPDNSHGSLGDDIHIEHHLHQSRHWSNYAHDAEVHLARYAEEGALGFRDGLGCPKAYYQPLWQRDFLRLAERFTVFGHPEATTEEVAELLWLRTRPLDGAERSAGLERLDVALGRVAGNLLL